MKEVTYHAERSSDVVIRLGDGTEESAARMAAAVEALHPYAGELFETDGVTERLASGGFAPDPATLRGEWDRTIGTVFAEARLDAPEVRWPATGGRKGIHGEELGHLLNQLGESDKAADAYRQGLSLAAAPAPRTS